MSTIFDTVYQQRPKMNVFNMSYDRKLSLRMGKLVPIHQQEVLPGDKFTHTTQQMIRFAPLIAPVMHKIDVYVHYWFVPYRLTWDGWEQFITSGGTDYPDFPHIKMAGSTIGSIQDYLDIPNKDQFTDIISFSALPTMAYWKIWYEWYRDQNLQTGEVDPMWEELESLADGDNTAILNSRGLLNGQPFKRAWTHDYFTSALPFAQKGDAVKIPMGTTAPLVFDPVGNRTPMRDSNGNLVPNNANIMGNSSYMAAETGIPPTPAGWANPDVSETHMVDLQVATAVTINELRKAYRLQAYLEKNARGGTRYAEMILSHFGVRSSDARLQRPEYLGGGIAPVSISEVVQQSESNDTPQGNLAGHGISVGQNFNFSRRFEEHGIIIGLMSVMPKPAYSQGIDRHMTKFDPLDWFWGDFAQIGEQAILKKELMATGTEEDNEVFGYIPRYAEYRQNFSRVNGDFKDTLDFWHLGRKFNNVPELNADFIQADPSLRIFAVQDLPESETDVDSGSVRNWDTLYAHIYHDIKAVRPIPKFDAPTW